MWYLKVTFEMWIITNKDTLSCFRTQLWEYVRYRVQSCGSGTSQLGLEDVGGGLYQEKNKAAPNHPN